MTRPRALDLFCGAGGATKGLQRAGFHVSGIDNRPQPRYCGDAFIQADALNPPVRLEDFDLVWASPPCQLFSSQTPPDARARHLNLIPQTRAMMQAAAVPYVIENVMPAKPHLRSPFRLCGLDFGLRVIRHRLFETNFAVMVPSHAGLCRRAVTEGRAVNVVGGGVPKWWRDREEWREMRRRTAPNNPLCYTTEERATALAIDWMTRPELCQAIPPAYSEHIGTYALMALEAKAQA